jgi:hypothetical protein
LPFIKKNGMLGLRQQLTGKWGGIIPRRKDTDFFAQITPCTKLGFVLFKMNTKV